MMDIYVERLIPSGKGKFKIEFSNGLACEVYRSECKSYHLEEGRALSEEEYALFLKEGIGKRAVKRAMHLLEQMDRTEAKLREKLKDSGYPAECIDRAVDYVKSYHYLDDYRYACTYVRYHMEKMSRQQLQVKLMQKGVGRNDILRALEEEYISNEKEIIEELLEKKNFHATSVEEKEFQRMYGFLMRRGFSSSDVLSAMKKWIS